MRSQADEAELPEPFRRAVQSLRAATVRPEITLEESPAPQRLAPHALALAAEVADGDGEELASGRLVLLYDPAGHETWHGQFRVVTFVRAIVEPELTADPVLASVGWSWLVESLEARDVPYLAPSGTVTRVVSESFGSMADRQPTAELEIRASWTALDSRLGPHLEAWAELLGTVAGLPPLTTGVATLSQAAGRSADRRRR
jgi:hypothetical protein